MARRLATKDANVQELGRVGTGTGGSHQEDHAQTDIGTTRSESPHSQRERSRARMAGSRGDEPHALQKRLWHLRRNDGQRSPKKTTKEARAIHIGIGHCRPVCPGERSDPIPATKIYLGRSYDHTVVARQATCPRTEEAGRRSRAHGRHTMPAGRERTTE